ncbi:hypothetical protein [uncultured Cohaesibacter sp.]|uniref:hypothetical protein n=1 Tax=uncultured Cohaesibacter sp. TaxID=1002546 RepID=UPI0029307F54|nr:hypothetical protein [uncultured Cohaesibacter sp.]
MSLTENALLTAAKGKTSTVEVYFEQLQEKMTTLLTHTTTANASTELQSGWKSLGDDPGSVLRDLYITKNPHPKQDRYKLVELEDSDQRYATIHLKHHAALGSLIEGDIFKDILFFDKEGNIYYSYLKGAELGKNLFVDKDLNQDLVQAASPIVSIAKTDPKKKFEGFNFTGFYVHDGKMTGYLVGPAMKWGLTMGAIAFEVNADRFTSVMSDRSGLGKTGGVELVSADMQQINFIDQEVNPLGAAQADLVAKAMDGQTITGDVDIKGELSLAIAEPMNVFGQKLGRLHPSEL